MFSHRGGWDKNNEVVSHLSVAPQNWCSLNNPLKCSKTPFASFLNVLFTTCFAPDKQTVQSVLWCCTIRQDGRILSCSDATQHRFLGKFWVITAFTRKLGVTSSLQTIMAALFFFCIEQHLTVLVTSHWNHVAEAESEALSQNIGHVFVHNPPGDNPKFLTYDCKD